MEAIEALERCGGVADRSTALRLTTRRRLQHAVLDGSVVRVGHGSYALPTAEDGLVQAHRVRGVLSHRSAAAWWGWELKTQPPVPEVTVPKHRRCDRRGVQLHWVDLDADDVREGIVTSRERTLVDCLRVLPFDEALAVADSALRHDDVSLPALAVVARGVRGAGAARVRRVAEHADPRAANPFESVLRALALEEQLAVRPQVVLRVGHGHVRPDLVDEERRVVLEADSFEWHGHRRALRRDCRRYNSLVVAGWRVLRFSWEDVIHEQDDVRMVLRAVARTQGRLRARRID